MALQRPVPVIGHHDLGAIHFIGVGGVSMSGIARLLAESGVVVSGSDREDSAALEPLRAAGVRVCVGHDAANLGDADTVVVNSAIREDNPELALARSRGLRVWHRSTALASLMAGRRGIGVSGTHGKTSTSGMVVAALSTLDPSYAVGSTLATTGTGAAMGAGEWFVIEADESDGSSLQYELELAAITNVEADHLDNWGTPAAYAAGFEEFARRPGLRAVVVSADDPGTAHLLAGLRAEGRTVVTFGEAADADVRLTDVDATGAGASATLAYLGEGGTLALAVPGRFNLQNAAAAYALARLTGIDDATARASLATFRGTARRFQAVAEVGGVRIVDDYAHHPTEVRATLVAARAAAGEGRVVACFQPHLYSRTRDFADAFGESLALADEAIVCDVYPAREDPIPGVTGALVAEAVARHGGSVTYVGDLAEVPGVVAALARPGDLVLTIGAGSVTTLGPRIAALLARRDR